MVYLLYWLLNIVRKFLQQTNVHSCICPRRRLSMETLVKIFWLLMLYTLHNVLLLFFSLIILWFFFKIRHTYYKAFLDNWWSGQTSARTSQFVNIWMNLQIKVFFVLTSEHHNYYWDGAHADRDEGGGAGAARPGEVVQWSCSALSNQAVQEKKWFLV